jgi:hypothetical protein
MYVQRNIESSSRSHCCHGKAVSVRYSDCAFVALVMQHAVRLRRIVLSSVTYNFFTLYHKHHDFREKKLNVICTF